MRLTLPREFYLPAAELQAVERRDGDVVAYVWEENGKILAKGFSGRSNKPVFYRQYSSTERRAAALDQFFAAEKAAADAKLARRAAKTAEKASLSAEKDLPVGTILKNSWGYDQTNVDFYKVVGHFGRLGVKLVKIGAKPTGEAGGSSMSDYVVADPDHCGAVLTARQTSRTAVKIGDESVSIWDGKPTYRSWYA